MVMPMYMHACARHVERLQSISMRGVGRQLALRNTCSHVCHLELKLHAVRHVSCWGMMSLHFASYFAESHSAMRRNK
jgi:hypothetical protein